MPVGVTISKLGRSDIFKPKTDLGPGEYDLKPTILQFQQWRTVYNKFHTKKV